MTKWILLLLPLTALAQEFTPQECATVGVDVSGHEATGRVVEESTDPIYWRYLVYAQRRADNSGIDYVQWHDPATWGIAYWIAPNSYRIQYETPIARQYAVCRAEYQVQFRRGR